MQPMADQLSLQECFRGCHSLEQINLDEITMVAEGMFKACCWRAFCWVDFCVEKA